MDKPQWAQRMAEARRLEREVERLVDEAYTLRCPAKDGGVSLCTADAQPEHAHRYRIEDMP